MTADHLIGIEQFEADLRKVADNLRANSNLASNEYFMPILGLIFLRHATNRYYAAMSAIEADKAAGKMPDRPLVEADFTRRRALMLPEPARYDLLLEMPKNGNLGAADSARTRLERPEVLPATLPASRPRARSGGNDPPGVAEGEEPAVSAHSAWAGGDVMIPTTKMQPCSHGALRAFGRPRAGSPRRRPRTPGSCGAG